MNHHFLEPQDSFYKQIDYKVCSPEDTIQRIRNILFTNDIPVIESHWFREDDLKLFSLTLATVDFPHRVQGKGINEKYALASAYAELIERLQNVSVLFGKNSIKKLNLPDQTTFNYMSFKENNEHVYQALFPKNKYSESRINEHIKSLSDIYNVSYYCVNNDSMASLPERLLVASTGSSGMCAGNTGEEAIIQGICEIFERFALKKIYYSNPDLPDIPRAMFKNYTVCSSFIEGLENRGFEVIIKDCSFGGRYPVVGVFLKKDNSCIFKLGASPHFSIATERCFTEIFQGRALNSIEPLLMPLDNDTNIKNDISEQEKYWREQFYKTATFDSGVLRSVILKKNIRFNENHLYTFDSLSSKSALIQLYNRSIKHETIYIRDTSFLGFPTFYIFMPAFSVLYYLDFNSIKLTEKEKLVKIFFNLENISEQERLYLNQVLQSKEKQYPTKEILLRINSFTDILEKANYLYNKLQFKINQYDFSQRCVKDMFS